MKRFTIHLYGIPCGANKRWGNDLTGVFTVKYATCKQCRKLAKGKKRWEPKVAA